MPILAICDGPRDHHLVSHDCAYRTRAGPGPQLLGAVDSQHRKNPFFDQVEQVEEPETEGDARIDEIGEAEHQEIDPEVQGDGVAEEFHAGLGDDRRDEIVIMVQGVDAVNEEGGQAGFRGRRLSNEDDIPRSMRRDALLPLLLHLAPGGIFPGHPKSETVQVGLFSTARKSRCRQADFDIACCRSPLGRLFLCPRPGLGRLVCPFYPRSGRWSGF
jgi:hypothetical protein